MSGYPEFFLDDEAFDGVNGGARGGTDDQTFVGVDMEANGA